MSGIGVVKVKIRSGMGDMVWMATPPNRTRSEGEFRHESDRGHPSLYSILYYVLDKINK